MINTQNSTQNRSGLICPLLAARVGLNRELFRDNHLRLSRGFIISPNLNVESK